MSERNRNPVHVWVVKKALAIKNVGDIAKLYDFCDVVRIDEGHDDIIAAIDHATEKLLGIKDAPATLKQVILQQKAEAEARKAEKANEVTDADKVEFFLDAVNELVGIAENFLSGDSARKRFFAIAKVAVECSEGNKTKADLQEAQKTLM